MHYPQTAQFQAQVSSGNRRIKETKTYVLYKTSPPGTYKNDKGEILFAQGAQTHGFQFCEETFDVKTNKRRWIRYAPGVSSPWMDEQEIDGNKVTIEACRKGTATIHRTQFKEGVLVLPTSNAVMIEYMDLSSRNGSNPNRDKSKPPMFIEVDSEAVYEQMDAPNIAMAEAMAWIYDPKRSLYELQALARLYEKQYNRDGFTENVSGVAELRWWLKWVAEQNPKAFLENKADPKSQKLHYMIEAQRAGIISIDPLTSTMSWGQHSGRSTAPIIRTGMGVDPMIEFVEKTFNVNDPEREAAETTYKEIQAKAIDVQRKNDIESGKINPYTPPNESYEDFKERVKGIGLYEQEKGAVISILWKDEPKQKLRWIDFKERYNTDRDFRDKLNVLAEELIAEKQAE